MKLSPLPDDPVLIADAIVRLVLISENPTIARDDIAGIVQQLIEKNPPPYVESERHHSQVLHEYFASPAGQETRQRFKNFIAGQEPPLDDSD